jgi:thiosulfate dehydrogenase [quinone] large subunit
MLERQQATVRRTASGRVIATQQLSRAEVLRRGGMLVGGLTLGIAGLATLFRGSYRSAALGRSTAATTPHRHHHRRPPAGTKTTGSGPPASSSSSSQSVPSGAVDLGTIPPGQAKTYTDPQDGGQDIAVRSASGTLSAVSAVCTHAGCSVEYQGGLLFCPCHGSQFNAQTGAVIQGPASTPLARKQVIQRNGRVYAV